MLAAAAVPVALWHRHEMQRRYWRGTGVDARRGRRPGEGSTPPRCAIVAELVERVRLPDYGDFSEGPVPVELFVANIVRGGIRKHLGRNGPPDIEALGDPAIVSLWLVLQGVTAPADEAEAALAQLREPAPIRQLRRTAEEIASARARYVHERHAYDLALQHWEEAGHVNPGSHGLLGFVLDQAEADPALWHAIATEIDLDDGDQLKTVLWAISQPECNPGTLAAFLSAIVSSRKLPELVKKDRASPGMALSKRICLALKRWDAGWPGAPWAAPSQRHAAATATSWAAAVRATEAEVGPLDWPEPKGLFRAWRNPVDVEGRHHWDPELGLMHPRPRETDFVTYKDDA
ncbi:hypothetical protein [Pseudoroseicyclus tamaricis]|uniref:Uncharacterized protein n=1 Tax=Pseudoroseicyclus tamaricis TaxID=2705421 RepID=A0A6B2JM27_9RHOB|nr:hypothetical protein [Pseudoroseicyclus tamaricis]NDV02633.1 hypothetical protein [Pseudoroseicyclus tamaricis]